MMSTNNILSPAHGKPIIVPSQDIVLGMYYMTRERPFAKGEGKAFSGPEEVQMAFDQGIVHLQSRIRCRINGEVHKTTVGRALLSEIVPKELPFSSYNKVLTKKDLADLIDRCFRRTGNKQTVLLADRIMRTGFVQAMRAG